MLVENDNDKSPELSSSDLSKINTSLALDRTLLAWVRTALTLIGFGFTLAKFVHDLLLKGALPGMDSEAPRILGFALMALGILALTGGAVENIRLKRKIGSGKYEWSASLIVAILLIVVSICFFVNLSSELKI